MATDESTVRRMVEGFSLVKACDTVQNGMLRIATPFQYADGSNVDLFLEADLSQELTLTDMGQTIAYLLDMHVKPWSSKRREQAVADICESLEIQKKGAQLYTLIPADDPAAFTNAIVRLSQACIRVAELALTQKFRMVSAFREDLEEFIATIDVPYETPFRVLGRFGEVELDFKTQGRTSSSLILTLSTQNNAAAHGLCNEVFRRWYDLSEKRCEFTFLTTFDTNTDVFRDDDLSRLREVSTVFGFPAEADSIQDALAA